MSLFKSLFFLLLFIVFYTGCSTKSDMDLKNIQKDKTKRLKESIVVSQDSSNSFKAYLNEDNEITFLCLSKGLDSCSYEMDARDEDLFFVSSLGYTPSIPVDTRAVQCGVGSLYGWLAVFSTPPLGIADHTQKNAQVCNHRFVELDSTLIPHRVVIGLLTFGTPLITGGNMHTKKFDKESFKEAVFESNIETYKEQLFDIRANYSTLDGFDVVYLEKDKIEKDLQKKYELLQRDSSKKSGVVFLQKDSNKLLWIGVFEEYRGKNLMESISLQIEDMFGHIQESDKYILKYEDVLSYIPAKVLLPSVPDIPKLVKDEFEDKESFEMRVQKAVQQRETEIRNLQRRYSLEVLERNNYIKSLQDSYKNYLDSKSRDRDIFLLELKESTPLLLKVLFLQNVSGYKAKDFNYDAQRDKMYFTIYSQKQNFSQEVVASIPAKIAKRIKLSESFEVVPNIVTSKNSIKLLGFDIVESESKKSFKTSYTNINFEPQEISVRVAQKKEKLDKEISKEFEIYMQKASTVVDRSKREIWYIDMAKSINAKVPRWFSKPQKTLKAVGYGEGKSLIEAKTNARNDLAYMLKVRIDASFATRQKVSSFANNIETKEKMQHSTDVKLSSEDYKLFRQDLVDGRWYVGLEYIK